MSDELFADLKFRCFWRTGRGRDAGSISYRVNPQLAMQLSTSDNVDERGNVQDIAIVYAHIEAMWADKKRLALFLGTFSVVAKDETTVRQLLKLPATEAENTVAVAYDEETLVSKAMDFADRWTAKVRARVEEVNDQLAAAAEVRQAKQTTKVVTPDVVDAKAVTVYVPPANGITPTPGKKRKGK